MGRYTLALDNWQHAWELTKDATNGIASEVADLTLVNWMSLLAKLGRTDTMREIFTEAGKRSFSSVSMQKQFNTSAQALDIMEHKPGISYRCGTYALAHFAEVTHELRGVGLRELLDMPSPPAGFSMLDLMGFVDKYKLNLVPALRPQGRRAIDSSVSRPLDSKSLRRHNSLQKRPLSCCGPDIRSRQVAAGRRDKCRGERSLFCFARRTPFNRAISLSKRRTHHIWQRQR